MKYLNPSFSVGGASISYDDGFERTFGAERKPLRGKFVYRKNEATGEVEAVEVGQDYRSPIDERQPVYTDRYMEGVQAQDGTDIGSRNKRREYMRVNSLADADDFKNTWEKAGQERARFYQGDHDHTARKEAIARAVHERKRK